MTPKTSVRRRRAAQLASWLGLAVAAVGFSLQVVQALPAGTPPEGVPELVPASGDSGTDFKLVFPSFIACPGDATQNYRWGTFITPIAQDPATLTFEPGGIPEGIAPSWPLFNTAQQPVSERLPSIGTGATGIQDVTFDYSRNIFETLVTGDYWVGVVCTQLDSGSVWQNVRYWSTAITITQQAGAGPNNFVWELAAAPAPTSTTTTTTTTTSVPDSAPTTTIDDAPTPTTTDPSTTGTTTSTSPTTFPTSGFGVSSGGSGGGPTTPTFSSGGSLPSTGSSTTAIIVWGVLLVVFGRMAILLGREPKVIPPAGHS